MDSVTLPQTGVDLGGIPLSRTPQIFRRNTRFASAVIRPDYQLLPRFGDPILLHVFKQIKKYNCFDDDVQSQSSPTKLRRPTVGPNRYATTRNTGRRSAIADGHQRLLVVYSARGFLARIVCFEGATPAFQS